MWRGLTTWRWEESCFRLRSIQGKESTSASWVDQPPGAPRDRRDMLRSGGPAQLHAGVPPAATLTPAPGDTRETAGSRLRTQHQWRE